MSISVKQHFMSALDALEKKEGQYAWDELEELITDAYEEETLAEVEFEELMRRLMDISCE